MKIENIDALKQWLVNVLNPIFDGDSEKLASYIVALAKKVENDQASRDRCISDLDVFLDTHTNMFVESLFNALLTKKYLNVTNSSANVTTTSAIVTSEVAQDASQTTQIKKKDFNETTTSMNRANERYKRSKENNNNSSSDESKRSNTNRFSDHHGRSGSGRNSYKGRLSRDYQEIDVSTRSTSGRVLRSRSRSNRARRKNRNRTHRGTGASSSSSSSSSSPSPSSSSRRFDGERKGFNRNRSDSYSPPSHQAYSPTKIGSGGVRKLRCKDFDEKGICTMAEYCPYDHGEVVIAPLMSNAGELDRSDNSNTQISSLISSNNNNSANTYPINTLSMPHQQHQYSNEMFMQQQRQRVHPKQRVNNNKGGPKQSMGMQMQSQQQPNQQRFVKQQQQQQQQQQANINQNEMFNLQQQRQVMGNRPRNLVNIVTSIHQEDQSDMGQQQPQQQQQRGIKRSYGNGNMPKSNFNNNQQQLQMQMQPGLMPTPPNQFLNQFQNTGFNQQQALLPTPPIAAQLVGPGNQMHQLQQNQQKFNTYNISSGNTAQSTPGANTQALSATSTSPIASSVVHNTTLVLRKVPIELNRVDKMRQHFSQFGQIVDIKCQYENTNDATLIQFATNQQAFAAYKSPQSVLNNRFIRIYWLSNYQKQHQNQAQLQSQQPAQQQNAIEQPQAKRHVKDRLGFSSGTGNQQEVLNKENKQLKNSVVATSDGSLVKTVFNELNKTVEGEDNQEQKTLSAVSIEANMNKNLSSNFNLLSIEQQQAEKKAAQESLIAARAIQDENQKKVLLLKLQVKQKARELIEKQIKDQKLLLKKFEEAKSVEEKSQILNLVKKLSESIEKEKEILNNKTLSEHTGGNTTSLAESSPTSPSFFSSSPFTFQKTSKPTTMIVPPPPHHLKLNNKRLNTTNFLKTQVGMTQTTPSIKEQPTVKPIASVASMFTYSRVSVDHRPKALLISGIENIQEKTAIINYVKALGCFIESVNEHHETSSSDVTSLLSFVINFATRKDAEIALAKCSSSLNSKTISITWLKSEGQSQKPLCDTTKETDDCEQKDTEKPESHENLAEDAGNLKDKNESSINEEQPNETSINESITEQSTQKEFLDALFEESSNYENMLS